MDVPEREPGLLRQPFSRRTILKVGAATPVAAFLAACGSTAATQAPASQAPATAAPATAAPATTAPSAAATTAPATAAPATPAVTPVPSAAAERFDGVEVNVFSGTAITPKLQYLQKGWEDLTGGKVVVTNIPYAERRAKLAGIIATADPTYDLAYAYESWIPGFDERLYVDISDTAGDTSDFLPGVLNSLKSPATGHLLALPMYSDQWTWQYNRELHEKAGVDPDAPPRTWQEYFDTTPKFREAGVYPSAAVWMATLQAIPIFLWMVFWNSYSKPMFSEDRTQVLFDGEDGLETFRTIEAGLKAGFWDPNSMTLAHEGESALLFNQGLVAAHMGWGSFYTQATSGDVANFSAKINPDAVAVATIPGISAGQSGTVNGSEGIGLVKFGTKQDAALSFLKYASNAESEKRTFLGDDANASSLTPSRTSVLNDPEVQAKFTIGPVWAEQGTFQNSLHAAPYDPAPVFAEVLAALAKGEITAAQAHDQAVTRTRDLIITYLSS
jgi:ABC-type glycerol-3-phosphate transport system substrate-binding protein